MWLFLAFEDLGEVSTNRHPPGLVVVVVVVVVVVSNVDQLARTSYTPTARIGPKWLGKMRL